MSDTQNRWQRVGPCLWRRGNEWRARVRFRADGEVRELQRSGTGTLAEARKGLRELHDKADQIKQRSLTVRNDGVSTFGDALKYYVTRRPPGRAEYMFDRMTDELGGASIAELRQRFDTWLLALRRGTSKRGLPYSNPALNRFPAWACAALNLCVRDGLLDSNPLAHFRREREQPREVTLHGEADRLRLLAKVREEAPHLEPLARFASLVPSRRGELCALRVADVDHINRVVRVQGQTTKNRQGRYLPIPPEMADYFDNLPAEAERVFHKQTADGRYLPLFDFHREWTACVKAADLVGLHFHDLRAYAATRLLTAGNDTRAVMAVAGWRTDMLRVYYRRDTLQTAQSVRFDVPTGAGVGASVGVGCGGREQLKAENC